MVKASVDGSIDFTACDQSRKWWRAATMKICFIDETVYTKVLELHAMRAISTQAMSDLGLDPQEKQKHARRAIETYQWHSMPWLGAPEAQNDRDSSLDDIAAWYARFGKEYHGP